MGTTPLTAGMYVRDVETVDELDVSVVLPVFNERGHLRAEIDRIQRAADRFAVHVRDHRRR